MARTFAGRRRPSVSIPSSGNRLSGDVAFATIGDPPVSQSPRRGIGSPEEERFADLLTETECLNPLVGESALRSVDRSCGGVTSNAWVSIPSSGNRLSGARPSTRSGATSSVRLNPLVGESALRSMGVWATLPFCGSQSPRRGIGSPELRSARRCLPASRLGLNPLVGESALRRGVAPDVRCARSDVSIPSSGNRLSGVAKAILAASQEVGESQSPRRGIGSPEGNRLRARQPRRARVSIPSSGNRLSGGMSMVAYFVARNPSQSPRRGIGSPEEKKYLRLARARRSGLNPLVGESALRSGPKPSA